MARIQDNGGKDRMVSDLPEIFSSWEEATTRLSSEKHLINLVTLAATHNSAITSVVNFVNIITVILKEERTFPHATCHSTSCKRMCGRKFRVLYI